jgi:hypothetical protein
MLFYGPSLLKKKRELPKTQYHAGVLLWYFSYFYFSDIKTRQPEGDHVSFQS